MKKRPLILLYLSIFALPIPIAVIGAFLSFVWFISVKGGPSLLETAMAFCGVVIGAAYTLTYIFTLYKTRNEDTFTFKTFLPAIHCFIALLFLLMLNPMSEHLADKKHFSFSKNDFLVVDELDTHGGFHGDGSYYLILDCSENKAKALENISDWEKLPLSENLNLIMYGGEKDGVTYRYNLAEEAKMPYVKNGYYCFKDRHSESKNPNDDSELFDRYSFNFSLAVYDIDTDTFYYFDFDT